MFDGDQKSDIVILLFWGMYILTFPICIITNLLIAAVAYYEISYLSYFLSGVSYVSLFCYWLFFFITGYFQWFKIIPFIAKKVSSSFQNEPKDPNTKGID